MTRRYSITSTGTGHTPEAALRSLLAAVAKTKAKDITERPKNPDKTPLGDPNVTKISTEQRRKLKQLQQNATA